MILNIKRKLVCVFFLLFSNLVFAEIVNFFTPKLNWFVENGIGFQNGNDFTPNTIVMDFYNELNMKEFICSSGIENSQEGFNFTTDAIYWPTFFKYFNLGVGSTFHILVRDKEFTEIDLLSGVFFKYSNLDWIEVQMNCSFFAKFAKIYAIDNSVPWLKNNNIAISIEVKAYPLSLLEVYLSFSSYSYYRYMLWFAPDLRFGASYKISSLLKIGTEIELQYIDMFTLSANCNSIDVRGFLRFNF